MADTEDHKRIRLFPDYDIYMMELLYQDALAALHVAASEVTLSDDKDVISRQIGEWNIEGHKIAVKANEVRRSRNLKARPQ